jgi:hypothetical protein
MQRMLHFPGNPPTICILICDDQFSLDRDLIYARARANKQPGQSSVTDTGPIDISVGIEADGVIANFSPDFVTPVPLETVRIVAPSS